MFRNSNRQVLTVTTPRFNAIVNGLLCLALCHGVSQSAKAAKATASSPPTCLSIVVPSYFYPSASGSAWDVLIARQKNSPEVGRTLIINPNSGAGNAANADFRNIVTAAHKAKRKVYGYVATGYGKVPMETAQDQVLKYVSWYGVDGIFVDEVSAEAKDVAPYYQPLATFITSRIRGGGVILNNGTYPDASYASIQIPKSSSLQIVIFEHDYESFIASSFAVPSWIREHPASMFVSIVYAVSAHQLSTVLRLSVERNIGGVYITDQLMPNPYAALPSYWTAEATSIQSGCRR